MSRVPCACKRLQAHPVKRVYPPRPVPTIGDPPLVDRMAEVVRTALGPAADVVVARLERRWPDAESALRRVYGAELDPLVDVIGEVMAAALAARSPDLKELDHRREAVPDWYQQPRMVGYVCYTDRFAGDLRGLPAAARLPGRAGGHLPAPDAVVAPAAGGERRRVCRAGL